MTKRGLDPTHVALDEFVGLFPPVEGNAQQSDFHLDPPGVLGVGEIIRRGDPADAVAAEDSVARTISAANAAVSQSFVAPGHFSSEFVAPIRNEFIEETVLNENRRDRREVVDSLMELLGTRNILGDPASSSGSVAVEWGDNLDEVLGSESPWAVAYGVTKWRAMDSLPLGWIVVEQGVVWSSRRTWIGAKGNPHPFVHGDGLYYYELEDQELTLALGGQDAIADLDELTTINSRSIIEGAADFRRSSGAQLTNPMWAIEERLAKARSRLEGSPPEGLWAPGSGGRRCRRVP